MRAPPEFRAWCEGHADEAHADLMIGYRSAREAAEEYAEDLYRRDFADEFIVHVRDEDGAECVFVVTVRMEPVFDVEERRP